MTIKEFARLCGCNPQTLRYYDHVDLLKPVKVDQWSGYRYYDEDQALAFIKIKNLQKAGFTIDVHNPVKLDTMSSFICAPEPVPAGRVFRFLVDTQSSFLQTLCSWVSGRSYLPL